MSHVTRSWFFKVGVPQRRMADSYQERKSDFFGNPLGRLEDQQKTRQKNVDRNHRLSLSIS